MLLYLINYPYTRHSRYFPNRISVCAVVLAVCFFNGVKEGIPRFFFLQSSNCANTCCGYSFVNAWVVLVWSRLNGAKQK